jgi:hypothetical protein
MQSMLQQEQRSREQLDMELMKTKEERSLYVDQLQQMSDKNKGTAADASRHTKDHVELLR